MNYGAIKKVDIANGKGVRVSLFVSGCTHHCDECFQPETWDFNYGNMYIKDTEQEIMDALEPYYVSGLSLLGGEPFEPQNQIVLIDLVRRVKSELPEKDIWVYSGYTYEQLLNEESIQTNVTSEMLSSI